MRRGHAVFGNHCQNPHGGVGHVRKVIAFLNNISSVKTTIAYQMSLRICMVEHTMVLFMPHRKTRLHKINQSNYWKHTTTKKKLILLDSQVKEDALIKWVNSRKATHNGTPTVKQFKTRLPNSRVDLNDWHNYHFIR